MEMELHKRKADWFYRQKRIAKKQAQKCKEFEAIAMDFGKNLPIPNISTNDVYYKRQLSFYVFNVHILSDSSSTFYTYDQTTGSKGSDDVVSMLYHFFSNILSNDVREIHIFCDSCSGQNKNWTVLRFLHYTTVVLKRFDKITVTYPVRGHSYMECDKNMALINQKTPAETPGDWREAIACARVKPSPFQVVECTTDMFKAWGSALERNYSKKFTAKTRPIKQIIFRAENTQTVQHRDTYTGAYSSTLIVKKTTRHLQQPLHLQLAEPKNAYHGCIPLCQAKYNDLQALKRFCRQEAQEFFVSLPVLGHDDDGAEERDSDY